MENLYNQKMAMLGYDQLVCDIFINWEDVKDEILIPERKSGSGNGTIHVFLGAADIQLRKEFNSYYSAVETGEDPSLHSVEVKHLFLTSNIISMLGYVCQYYHLQNKNFERSINENLTLLDSYDNGDGLLATQSLLKLSTGSNKLRPYFKQFESNGVFVKLIRQILLPNSAYKISLYKNSSGQYAAFWLIGFDSQTNFEADSSVSHLKERQPQVSHHSFPLQQIYYGAPGTGKSHEIKEQTAEAEEQGRVFRTTFHPDSDYSTFVGCYKPNISQKAVRNVAGDVVKKDGKEVFEDYISYQFVPQAFTNAYVKAWQTNGPVFLIIEEINRGNCAQIFGDLFQLLDRGDDGVSDYPIKADSDLCKYLEKELGEGHDGIKDGKIRLPRNLHIWATMNTSDQSLFPIDSAFKRRWDWHYTPICNAKKGWKVEANGNQYDWWDFLQKINERIERATSSEDKQLGYFFCKPDGNGVISAEKFVSKVIFYLWNDVFKDFADSSDDPFKVADGNRMTFRTFYTADDNGKTIVNEDNVEALLGSLGVVSTFIDADELENSNGVKGFLINGEVEKVMMHVPSKVVSLYVEKNPDLSAAEIVSIWNTLETKGQYVFTSEEIQQKKTASIDEKLLGRYDPLSLKNGETIYVWNQMIQERIDDFSKKVNAQSWGIHIEPIA